MSDEMSKKPLYNPEGTDALSERRIIKGDSTNLINLNNVKYTWATKLWRVMLNNFWIPEKVDMTADLRSYDELTEDERRAYMGIVSFLVFLDSLQTANLPNIGDYITAPEVAPLIVIQDFQEAVHAKSYAYLIESAIPVSDRETIYEFWRKDPTLYQRNTFIAEIYQRFADDPSDEAFADVVIANYLLEGLYFYNGFQFFYNLASRNRMSATADMIRYIQRDELTHTVLFEHLIREIQTENPGYFKEERIQEMFRVAVEQEIAWSEHIQGENIMGITKATIREYTQWMANQRIVNIGYGPLYPESGENPYKHLESLADEFGEAAIRGNFFESTNTSYNQSAAVDGWDDF